MAPVSTRSRSSSGESSIAPSATRRSDIARGQIAFDVAVGEVEQPAPPFEPLSDARTVDLHASRPDLRARLRNVPVGLSASPLRDRAPRVWRHPRSHSTRRRSWSCRCSMNFFSIPAWTDQKVCVVIGARPANRATCRVVVPLLAGAEVDEQAGLLVQRRSPSRRTGCSRVAARGRRWRSRRSASGTSSVISP